MSRPTWPAWLVCFCLLTFVPSGLAASPGDDLVPAWLEVPEALADPVTRTVADSGGRVLVRIPERRGMLVRIPRELAGDLERGGVRASRLDPAAAGTARARAPQTVIEHLRAARSAPRPAPGDPRELGRGRALVGPDWWELEGPGPRRMATASTEDDGRPFGADWQNTSEYLAGDVSINLMLVESNGSIDADRETWSSALENEVIAEAADALADVVEMHPGARLTFTMHVLSGRSDSRLETSYEPIARPADTSGTDGVELWMNEVLAALGYADGARLSRSRQLADATRVSDGSDWAVNVFVVNSEADADGRFEDGDFAYCWMGGPHAVLTTDNSGWGLSRFHQVLRHELHHAFFALDQYAASNCSCSAVAGYTAAANDNCELDCGSIEPDVMINNVKSVSAATQELVGTYDGDLDGTSDLLQVPPAVSLELDPERSTCDGLASLVGVAEVVPPVNVNPWLVTPRRNVSLREIADVELSVDDGPWESGVVYADDGTFDGPVEPYSFSLALSNGRHRIQVRAVDDLGQHSSEATLSVDAAEDAQPVGATLSLTRGDAGTLLGWQPAEGAGSYLVRRASRPGEVDDSFPVTEVAVTEWRDVAPGTVFYRITSVDACGREVGP